MIADLQVQEDGLLAGARLQQPVGRLVQRVVTWLGPAAKRRPETTARSGSPAQ